MPDHDPIDGYDEDPASKILWWLDIPLAAAVIFFAFRQPEPIFSPFDAMTNAPTPTPIVTEVFPRSGVVERQYIDSEIDVPDMKLAAVSTPFQ